MPWDNGLTTEQRNVVSFIDTHARLLAGPGTGKTRSITKKIVYLIIEQQIDPSKILVLTFTRAATAELKNRVQQELISDYKIPYISTLHSFALKTILKSSLNSTRLPNPIRIADDYEERWIIQEDLKILLQYKIKEICKLLNKLSADWEQLTADIDGWEERFPDPKFLGAWHEHRNIYSYILRAELVYQLKQIVDEREIDISDDFEYILVDEYQDLNACDLAVIKYLSGNNVKLFVAGDDDQSIYGFRYANPEGIRRFINEYSPATSLNLEECKRCDQKILNLALYIARQDTRRIDKNLYSSINENDNLVKILNFADQDKEAENIGKLCQWLINNKGINPSNILILLRADNNQIFSNLIREKLEAISIPVATVTNPLEIFEVDEGRNFLSLLRLIVNRKDNLAWRTILKIRKNNIGDNTFLEINELARSEGKSFYDILLEISIEPTRINKKGPVIKKEFEEITVTIEEMEKLEKSDLYEYINKLANAHIIEDAVKTKILNIINKIIKTAEINDLEELLRSMNSFLDKSEQEQEESSVNIMSMHQAKGLTADAVFIVAAEDEYIPGQNNGGTSIEDERRLLYVSLTRATRYLFITHCKNRYKAQMHTGRNSGKPNRRLTQFLSGGPIKTISGIEFINNLVNFEKQ